VGLERDQMMRWKIDKSFDGFQICGWFEGEKAAGAAAAAGD
jgi:hypothetical protein